MKKIKSIKFLNLVIGMVIAFESLNATSIFFTKAMEQQQEQIDEDDINEFGFEEKKSIPRSNSSIDIHKRKLYNPSKENKNRLKINNVDDIGEVIHELDSVLCRLTRGPIYTKTEGKYKSIYEIINNSNNEKESNEDDINQYKMIDKLEDKVILVGDKIQKVINRLEKINLNEQAKITLVEELLSRVEGYLRVLFLETLDSKIWDRLTPFTSKQQFIKFLKLSEIGTFTENQIYKLKAPIKYSDKTLLDVVKESVAISHGKDFWDKRAYYAVEKIVNQFLITAIRNIYHLKKQAEINKIVDNKYNLNNIYSEIKTRLSEYKFEESNIEYVLNTITIGENKSSFWIDRILDVAIEKLTDQHGKLKPSLQKNEIDAFFSVFDNFKFLEKKDVNYAVLEFKDEQRRKGQTIR